MDFVIWEEGVSSKSEGKVGIWWLGEVLEEQFLTLGPQFLEE